jgi:preprotein translocase subunit SecF
MAKKMFEIIPDGTTYDFVSMFKFTAAISLILVIISLFGIFTQMNYGVDFRGGAEIQVKFGNTIGLDQLRSSLSSAGFPTASVQNLGDLSENEFLLKLQGDEENLNQIAEAVESSLVTTFADAGVEIRKVDIVGPRAGAALRISGFQAMLWALIAIMIYIGLRFDFKYSPGAIAALFHDVTIVLGIFAFTHFEFTLQTVAAMLAVIGYSVNDTVVVYDRVREHESMNPALPLSTHINRAVNETLSRTILTSGTTLFISVTMYIWGGIAIRDFFLAISLGVLIGTYSTIFVAAPVTLFFDRLKKGGVSASASTGEVSAKA